MNQYGTNFRAPKVDVHDFSMAPRADIPRSQFRMQTQHKTTFSASNLIPIYLQEVLPGDTFNCSMTAFCRMATPLYPLMDNLDLETFFFFVPNRIIWTHWVNFMGEQQNPGDSTSYNVPQIVSPVGGFAQLSVYDYFGLPCTGQTAGGNTISVSALPLRAYSKIYNDWFRDQNLENSATIHVDDGPDPSTDYGIVAPCKRPDYFTTCLPWTQKGGIVTTPLAGTALVRTSATELITTGTNQPLYWRGTAANAAPPMGAPPKAYGFVAGSPASLVDLTATGLAAASGATMYPTNLYADLTTATAQNINQLRFAFQTQRLLERNARSGSRYVELILAHFGVRSPDFRLQRAEFLSHGKTPITVTPVPQTTATGLTGGNSPLGTLAAAGTAIARHGFSQSFTEHGHIIGVACVRQDMGYQQGIRRLWKRLTQYDFYFPVFQALGEQAVLNSEIFSDGSANDALTFGFQERWAEYRYHPSTTSAYFRSTNTTPIDSWHLVEKFGALPTLNTTFIQDSTYKQVQRAAAAGALSANQQFLCDFFFDCKAARPMPMYSIPGMIDHF